MPEFMPEFTQGFSGKNGVAMAVNPVEGWTFAAKRAVYGAVNSMLAAGAASKAISLSILMPEEAEEKQLKALIKEIDSLCMQENILVPGIQRCHRMSAHLFYRLLQWEVLREIRKTL